MTLPRQNRTPLIMVTGSRDWSSRAIIRMALTLDIPYDKIMVMHGGARGADTMAGEVAEQMGYDVRVYPADWETHGKRAGIMRNVEMLEEVPDIVFAFHKSGSRGTAHAIREAKKRGIPGKAWIVEDDYTTPRVETWAFPDRFAQEVDAVA